MATLARRASFVPLLACGILPLVPSPSQSQSLPLPVAPPREARPAVETFRLENGKLHAVEEGNKKGGEGNERGIKEGKAAPNTERRIPNTDLQPQPPLPKTPTTPETLLWPTTQENRINPYALDEAPRYGWSTGFIGAGRGDFDISVGAKIWPDRFYLRNLIFGGTVDLAPGIRARAQLRRREGERQFFQVDSDEVYLEAFNQYRAPNYTFGANLRAGRMRYLHFPFPDAIAMFDQVPGISDLYGGPRTDYRDVVAQAELALNNGFGAHVTGQAQFLNGSPDLHAIEAYAFYRNDFGRSWHIEGRAGALAVRHEPLGRTGQLGANVYLGKQIGEFNVGLLYENKTTEHEYGGIMVQFRPNTVTKALGQVMFDYSRQPEGFTVQVPLLHARLRESRFVRSGDVLVGEVRAIRLRTLWQQGFVRNQYEHRLESWGETSDPRLHCVITEEPIYLQAEALVTPHLVPDARAERDRQGPGQYAVRVTYRFYRPFRANGNPNAPTSNPGT